MPTFDGSNHLPFFKTLHRNFSETLQDDPDRSLPRRDPIESLLEDCFEIFERNSENAVGVVCHGGCASCCTIRVAATAPEILLIARTLRSSTDEVAIALRQRISAADQTTRQLDEQGRMASGSQCPFVEGGLCVIYAVRPLACRGHASYDEQACVDALAGHPCEVPVSELHVTVRSLVQNAMQAALRDAGYAWGAYELNQALHTALTNEICEAAWLKGHDVFAAALIEDVSLQEMAETFDAIKAL